MFLITYDEHGGFYDHIRPPGIMPTLEGFGFGGPPDDRPQLKRHGVRVPTLLISPWVERGSVSHIRFDHTAILSTILRCYCDDAAGNIPSMGARTDAANDLGPLLSALVPRTPLPAPSFASADDRARSAIHSPDSFGGVLRKLILGV